MIHDLRFGTRMLLKNPGFAAVAVLTLALGIGANTAVFSIIGSVLYPPLPVTESQRLVSVYGSLKGNYGGTSFPDYVDYRDRLQSYNGLAAYGRVPLKLRSGNVTEEIGAELVTGNFFSTLGVGAAAGRLLTADDDRTAAAVAVVSHRMWRERFGGDPQLIGRSVNLNGQYFTVVGVAPEGFSSILLDWGKQPQVWIPLAHHLTAFRGADVLFKRDNRWLMVVGRLKNGISIEQAEAETRTLAGQLAASLPQNDEGRSVVLFPTAQTRFWPGHRDEIVRVLALLETIAALALSVACFNVASLLLVRAAARRKDEHTSGARRRTLAARAAMAERKPAARAIGCRSRTADCRLADAAAGKFQSPFKIALRSIRALIAALDSALLITVLTSVIFGLTPAWRSARIGTADALRKRRARPELTNEPDCAVCWL